MNTNETNRIANLLDENDPRLTAYVLGELSAEDAAIVEAALVSDASLRAHVDSIRATVSALELEFHAEHAAQSLETPGSLAAARTSAAATRPWESSNSATLNGAISSSTAPQLKLTPADPDAPLIYTQPAWLRRLIAGLGFAAAATFALTATLPLWQSDFSSQNTALNKRDSDLARKELDIKKLESRTAGSSTLGEFEIVLNQPIPGPAEGSAVHFGAPADTLALGIPVRPQPDATIHVPYVAPSTDDVTAAGALTLNGDIPTLGEPTAPSGTHETPISLFVDLEYRASSDRKQSAGHNDSGGSPGGARREAGESADEPARDKSTTDPTSAGQPVISTGSAAKVPPPPPSASAPPSAPARPSGELAPGPSGGSGLRSNDGGKPASSPGTGGRSSGGDGGGAEGKYGFESTVSWDEARFADGQDVPFVDSDGAPIDAEAEAVIREILEATPSRQPAGQNYAGEGGGMGGGGGGGGGLRTEDWNVEFYDNLSVDEAKHRLNQVAKARRYVQSSPELDARLQAECRGLLHRIRRSGTPGTENYNYIDENDFLSPADAPLSTFAIDVDTASYANMRRFLRDGQLPPRDAIRIEELINYFPYAYTPPQSESEHPFSANVEIAPAPWQPKHRLVRIGLKGKEADLKVRPPTNLVFLLDVSGSMNSPDKLPLVQSSIKALINELNGDDRIALVVYAGAAGLVLPSTFAHDKNVIMNAIDALSAGGSTAGGAGIQLAYNTAAQHFIKDGVNRVILCTDGDFNVGITGSELIHFIEEKRKSNIFLSVLGFGTGNLQDGQMEQLANHGNGHYAYIDSLMEGRKVLVEEMGGTLITIAKDVKIQIEFNPSKVAAYRQIGYENRALAAQDFNDDTKDAGEIGAGHAVTALYEIVPVGVELNLTGVDALKYQKPAPAPDPAIPDGAQAAPGMAIVPSNEMLTVKFRYKKPEGAESTFFDIPVEDAGSTRRFVIFDGTQSIPVDLPSQPQAAPSPDFQFASAVAAFGMVLRDSAYKGSATYANILDWAAPALGEDPAGYRAEFIELVDRARRLSGQ